MGKYVVNGEVVDIQEDRPTALDLKNNAGSVLTDWVMAKLPSGEVVKLEDHEALPSDATDYRIHAPFIYGDLNSRIAR